MASAGAPNNFPVPWKEDHTPNVLSLLHRCPAIRAAVDALPADYLMKTDNQLVALIRKRDPDGLFDRTLGVLKIQFWQEYAACFTEKRSMLAENIFQNVCNSAWFYTKVVQDPLHLAFVTCPPVDEMLLQREMLARGMGKLRESLELPITETYFKTITVKDKDGNSEKVTKPYTRINVAFLREIHAIVKTMQDRVNGAVVQRQQIESKTLSVNMNQGALPKGSMSIDDPGLTMDQLDAFAEKIGKLQDTIQKALPATEVIDAEPE